MTPIDFVAQAQEHSPLVGQFLALAPKGRAAE